MDKNLFLAVVLSMAVLLFWQVFVMPPVPVRRPADSEFVAPEQSTPGQSPLSPAAATSSGENLPAESAAVDRSAERIVVVETPLYRAELTSWGGALKSFQLKKYARAPRSHEAVEMVPQLLGVQDHFHTEYHEADKVDLLLKVPGAFEKILLPYSLRFVSQGGLVPVGPLYQVEAHTKPIQLLGNDSTKIVFQLNSPAGLTIVKTLTFRADSYLTDVDVEVRNSGTAVLDFTPEMVVTEGYRDSGIRVSTQYDHSSPVYGAGAKRHLADVPELGAQKAVDHAKLEWAAVEDLYFFSGLVPRGNATTLLVEKTRTLGFLRLLLRYESLHLSPGESVSFNAHGYYGPKEFQRLTEIGFNLENIVDYGWFRFLALPAVAILKFIDRVTGSYGLAIIVLTFLLKIVTYPLTNAQLKSMEKMKALSPDMEKLRAKYKDSKEPERLNQEMMALYKRHNVNPVSGCLPVFIQMPIFLALYAGLLYSIELRHKGFLYIPDLSTPDPYYLSPILMGVSMLWQTRMSPAPADPSQATLMRVMPIIFTFMFLFAPAGLVIYWLLNNVLSIGQQYYLRSRASAVRSSA